MQQNTSSDPFESELRTAQEQLQANRLPEAEQAYRNVLRASPAHPAANFGLGMLLHRIGADQPALEYLETAVAAQLRPFKIAVEQRTWHLAGYVSDVFSRIRGQLR